MEAMKMDRRSVIVGAGAAGLASMLPKVAAAALPVEDEKDSRFDDLMERLNAPCEPAPVLATVPVTDKFLSPAALKQSLDVCKRTHREVDVLVRQGTDGDRDFSDYQRQKIPCQYLSIPVTLRPDGEVEESHVRRWSVMLNDLADRGLWSNGCLAPTTVIGVHRKGEVYYNDLRLKVWDGEDLGYMYTFLFPDAVYTPGEFNKKLGHRLVMDELDEDGVQRLGSLHGKDMTCWDTFPWA